MRALCGAIITAGALIGLGMAAIGIGTRYEAFTRQGEDPLSFRVHFSHMDTGLIFVVTFLTMVGLVGLGITFVGLAYHHERRHREHLLAERHHSEHGRVPVPPA
jgi:hypothetical protein